MDFRNFFNVNDKTRNIILICCAAALSLLIVVFSVLAVVMSHKDAPDPTLNNPTVPATSETPTEAPTDAPTEAPTEAPKEHRYTLSFAGDCTLGSQPSWMSYSRSFTSIVGTDYSYPFKNVQQYFANDDCTFVNLEGVFANSGKPEIKKFTFRGPTTYVNILTEGSVEAVSTANNHSFDFGEEGYASTKQVLEEKGIHYAGQKETTVFTTESGLTIGLYGLYATNYDPKPAEMKEAVQKMRDEGAEIIIASIHWGEEAWYSTINKQKRNGHDLIDAGVDIVWGHHPHVLQRIEEYNGGYICYSLGNFSFGGNHNPKDKDTVVIQQEVIRTVEGEVKLGKMTLIPCRISSRASYNDFAPTPYEEGTTEYNRVLSKLKGTYKSSGSSSSTTAPTKAPTTAPTEAPTTAPEVTTAPTEVTTDPPQVTTDPPQVTTDPPSPDGGGSGGDDGGGNGDGGGGSSSDDGGSGGDADSGD